MYMYPGRQLTTPSPTALYGGHQQVHLTVCSSLHISSTSKPEQVLESLAISKQTLKNVERYWIRLPVEMLWKFLTAEYMAAANDKAL